MSRKRSNYPPLLAFGQRLTELRGERSRKQIALRLKRLNSPIGEPTLLQYENGRVWAPDPGVLYALARIYNVRHDELVRLLMANRADPDALAHDWRRLLRLPDVIPDEEVAESPDKHGAKSQDSPLQHVTGSTTHLPATSTTKGTRGHAGDPIPNIVDEVVRQRLAEALIGCARQIYNPGTALTRDEARRLVRALAPARRKKPRGGD